MNPTNTSATPRSDAAIKHGAVEWIAPDDCRAIERDLAEAVAALESVTGSLAESLALDMDHKCKDHSRWYANVQKARELIKRITPAIPEPNSDQSGTKDEDLVEDISELLEDAKRDFDSALEYSCTCGSGGCRHCSRWSLASRALDRIESMVCARLNPPTKEKP